MADREHLDMIRQGADVWNAYSREQAFEFPRLPDLREANLQDRDLAGIDLTRALLEGANLRGSDLSGAVMTGAKLDGAELGSAKCVGADLREAHLNKAGLTCADLSSAQLDSALLISAYMWGGSFVNARMHKAQLATATIWESDLRGAQMTGANLFRASVVKSNLQGADLSGSVMRLATFSEVDLTGATLNDCHVYGMSAWDLQLKDTNQQDLVISDSREGGITVDNLEVAQFIHLLTNNRKIASLIDTITSKTVLILGRFTPERKAVLDALRERLRDHDYVSILFDFENPANRSLTETVATLAHMARFVIADITDAKSIPQELQRIIPDNPSVPVRPLILDSQYEYAMFRDFMDYPWVLTPYRYRDLEELLACLNEQVIAPAVARASEVQDRRRRIEKEMAEERRP